ncbi:MAG TPA: hypothetical protein ENN32_02245 [Chloroflexi bacterium]|nr:hypothetical protein [Chloroflexota bacterium]
MKSLNLNKKPLLLIAIIITLVTLACRAAADIPSASAFPVPEISQQSADKVEALLDDVQSQSGSFAFTITDQEMTSYLTLKMAENQESPPIENLNVVFSDNQIFVYGDVFVQNLGMKLPAVLVIAGRVDTNGTLQFELISAQVGRINMPAFVQDQISKATTGAMNSQFSKYLSGYRIDNLYIDQGMLTVSGGKR